MLPGVSNRKPYVEYKDTADKTNVKAVSDVIAVVVVC